MRLRSFLDLSTRDYLQLLYRTGTTIGLRDILSITGLADAAVKAQRNPSIPNPLAYLEERWYTSTDYSVYAEPAYLAEAFLCWMTYSRKYLRSLRMLAPTLEPIATIADLGCGLGFTTAALSTLYPNAQVTGTNVDDSIQMYFARALDATYSEWTFRICPDVASIGRADLVFASEYFEHFPRPLAHLRDVLDTLQPRILVVASTFSQPSIGHFNSYEDGLSGKRISKLFGITLKERGYTQVETAFWNNRPAVWQIRL